MIITIRTVLRSTVHPQRYTSRGREAHARPLLTDLTGGGGCWGGGAHTIEEGLNGSAG